MKNFAYHGALLKAKWVRALYSKTISTQARRLIKQNERLPVIVYSFSCERDLPEQVISIRSFIQQVGIPEHFTVVSDGSYSQASINILESIHACVAVVSYESVVQEILPVAVQDFARISPYGKKLAVAMSLPISQTTIMTDADVVFFSGAPALAELITNEDIGAWYLCDTQPALDARMINCLDEQKNPVNCGFMLLKKKLHWRDATQRLACLQEEPISFSEQTVVHFAMHNSGAKPLRRDKFVLELDDQVCFSDWYFRKNIALRHYVNPVRHKMWSCLHR